MLVLLSCSLRLHLKHLFLAWQRKAAKRETSEQFVDSLAWASESTNKSGLIYKRLRRLYNKGEYQIQTNRALGLIVPTAHALHMEVT